jgi:hypothetical protein
MKEITVEQLASHPADWLKAAQSDRLVIIEQGKPSAVVFGIENLDEEDWDLQLSPEFWRMIEERRREPTIPWEQAKAQLFKNRSPRRKKVRTKRSTKSSR